MPDGTFVVGGEVGGFATQINMALWRFNADGSLDTGFGSGGLALGPANYGGGQPTLAPNGDIVQLGGGGFGVGGTVAFYRNDGTLDASVGSGGESDFAAMDPFELAFQPSGQIVVIGVTVNAAGGQGTKDRHWGNRRTEPKDRRWGGYGGEDRAGSDCFRGVAELRSWASAAAEGCTSQRGLHTHGACNLRYLRATFEG